MTVVEIVELCRISLEEHGHVVFTAEQLLEISADQVDAVRQSIDQTALLKLPEHEVEFFDWLRTADAAVWEDLWGDSELAPYIVGFEHLRMFAGAGKQGVYHICDLQKELNYFFTPEMFYIKESPAYVGAIQDRFADNASLTATQALALEAKQGPVDIWHFSFRTGVKIERLKTAVQSLVDNQVLVHVPIAAHLIEYFDVK